MIGTPRKFRFIALIFVILIAAFLAIKILAFADLATTTTYQSLDKGFGFDYNNSWKLYEEENDVVLYSYDPSSIEESKVAEAVPSDQIKMFIWKTTIGAKDLEQWLIETDKTAGEIAPPTPKIISSEPISIDGYTGVKRLTEDSYGNKHLSYYVKLGEEVFVINSIPGNSLLNDKLEELVKSVVFVGK